MEMEKSSYDTRKSYQTYHIPGIFGRNSFPLQVPVHLALIFDKMQW